MKRRDFLWKTTGGCPAMAFSAGAAEPRRSIIAITTFKMGNTQDAMTQRTNEFLAKVYVPALGRFGGAPGGVFNNLIGPDSPQTLVVTQYPTLAAWDEATAKLAADGEFTKANNAYLRGPLQFVRMDVTLLRAFPSIPAIEVPKPREG